MILSRRSALLGLTSAFTLAGVGGRASLALAAAATDRRLIVIILRGALDGMAAVVPYGDPHLAQWRPELIPGAPGQAGGLLDLGGFYGLHPALARMHALYAAGELLPVHAVAGPYRSRSHFEAQDYMESGSDHLMTSGWLNRVVSALPAGHQAGADAAAVSIGLAMPLLLRGPATVGSWTPAHAGKPPPDLYARIAALAASDTVIGPALREGLRDRGFADGVGLDPADQQGPAAYAFPALATAAGKLLAAPDGPRIAALDIGGWDTHAGQMARLRFPLGQLDAGIAALKAALGPAWAQTAVLTITEFGRTVRANGTGGTDHGTGTVAFVAGGAVSGGRVRADWPGLAENKLFENRDLQPTAELRSVAKGLLIGHLGLPHSAMGVIFPGGDAAPPMGGLLRA